VRLVAVRLEVTVQQLQAELTALTQHHQQPQQQFLPPLLSMPFPAPSLPHEPPPPLRALLPPPPQVTVSFLADGSPAEQAAPLAPLVTIQLATPLAPAKAISDDGDCDDDGNDNNTEAASNISGRPLAVALATAATPMERRRRRSAGVVRWRRRWRTRKHLRRRSAFQQQSATRPKTLTFAASASPSSPSLV
jgi:hypothetical protein